jgi:hypothetical protein
MQICDAIRIFTEASNSQLLAGYIVILFNPLTPNDLQRRRAVSPLKIKIAVNMCEKSTNATIIHSVY